MLDISDFNNPMLSVCNFSPMQISQDYAYGRKKEYMGTWRNEALIET